MSGIPSPSLLDQPPDHRGDGKQKEYGKDLDEEEERQPQGNGDQAEDENGSDEGDPDEGDPAENRDEPIYPVPQGVVFLHFPPRCSICLRGRNNGRAAILSLEPPQGHPPDGRSAS